MKNDPFIYAIPLFFYTMIVTSISINKDIHPHIQTSFYDLTIPLVLLYMLGMFLIMEITAKLVIKYGR